MVAADWCSKVLGAVITRFGLPVVCVAAALLAAPATGRAAADAWTATGSMGDGRSGETMTVLRDGDVLVAGGSQSGTSAEIYDPSTGSWTPTGSMTTARTGADAVLLDNGDVLVVGGSGDTGPIASAEIYDPDTGAWSSAGSMSTGRWLGTATLLPQGDVLVTGGLDSSNAPTATADLYDPATATWSATAPMSIPREGATATLLADGDVLVAGGGSPVNNTAATTATAELYDPASGTWTATGSMWAARGNATATLLGDGDVLIAGGDGQPNGDQLAGAELYDPITRTWSVTGSLTEPRVTATATLLPDGDVLEAGGALNSATANDNDATAELYDPTIQTWSLTGPMTATRNEAAAAVLDDGQVLVAGGYNSSSQDLSTAELYQPVLPPPRFRGVTASSVSATTALLQGLLDPEGSQTSYHFELSTDPQFSAVVATPTSDAGAGNFPAPISAQVSGLQPATTYYVRLAATNGNGSATGPGEQFTTSDAPVIRRRPADDDSRSDHLRPNHDEPRSHHTDSGSDHTDPTPSRRPNSRQSPDRSPPIPQRGCAAHPEGDHRRPNHAEDQGDRERPDTHVPPDHPRRGRPGDPRRRQTGPVAAHPRPSRQPDPDDHAHQGQRLTTGAAPQTPPDPLTRTLSPGYRRCLALRARKPAQPEAGRPV